MKMTRLSKSVTGLLAASMIFTGAGWTTSSASAAAKQFSDVVSGHWAQKHLSKLTMQEILSGYPDGTFLPNKSVSHQEAVIIAIRFMGLEDELDSSDVIVLPESLKIKDDYKKYLNLAFKKQLLNLNEEVALAEQDPSKEWGKSPASREWVTRLLVRAIGKDSEAKQAATETTEFPDDDRIGAQYRGYVNVAVSTGLVKGVATLVKGVTITEFAPIADVTRASIATLFSLAQAEVAFSGQVSGVLLAITPTQLTLLHEGGGIHNYSLMSDSLIYRYDSNASAALEQLKLYGKVILISNSDKSIGYVEQTLDTPQIKTYEGTLTLHTADLNRLTVLIGTEYETFTYDPQYLPAITDSNGKSVLLKDLPTNVEVKLSVDTIRTDGKIIAVEVKQSVVNKNGSGRVAEWNPSTRSLHLDDPFSDMKETLTVSANATIKNNIGANLTFDQLKAGDMITYEVKTGLVSSIVVTKSSIPAVSGILVGVVKSNNSIQYTVNNSLESDFLAANAKVKIDGIPEATFEDIYAGDAISLTFNDNGDVIQISVTNRTVKNMIGATIIDYAGNAKTLIVNDLNGIKHNFDVTSTTKFELNGTYLTLEAAASYLSTVGKKINIAYTGDNLVTVSLVAKFTGTVIENNAVTRTIKVMIDATNSMTLSYTNAYAEVYSQSSISLADIAVGDQVTIIQNGLQNQLSTIQIHKNVQFEVVSVTPASSKIKVKGNDGVTVEWTLASNAVLQNENGTAVSLSAFSAGSLVNVSFQGTTPVKIKAVQAGVFGKVSSVNMTASSLDLVTGSNAAVTRALGTNPIIMRDNTIVASLASVMPEDRVEIRKDENDRTIVQIITPLKKTVQSVNVSTSTLVIKKATINDTNFTFTVDSSVYIHQGSTTLNLSSLTNGDPISLYFVRGKLLEIVK
ncbi:S-layer homology domain-containing protein [Cohnella sp.]|uniref:S-layer homology domain-containing protein n=1 Tax=Cohnella sp. TaxID=1883426 RepID=UPI00356B16D5